MAENNLFDGLKGTIFEGQKPVRSKEQDIPFNNPPDGITRDIITLMNNTNGYVNNSDEISYIVNKPNTPITQRPDTIFIGMSMKNFFRNGIRGRR